MLKKLTLGILCLVLMGFLKGQDTKTYSGKPVNLNDGIQTATLAEVGFNIGLIEELNKQLDAGVYPNIHSVLIYKNDKLVFEKYYRGKDELWGDDLGVIEHRAGDLHDIRSISKSVVSACIGIAIDQGKIKSIDQKVFDFFKEYSVYDTGMKKELSIKHLLMMTSGLEWNEDVPYDNPENSEIQMTESADPIEFVLSRPMALPAGKEWKYNGGTTQLLAAIIERVSGKKLDAFASEYLFKPLGIKKFEWVKFPGTNNPAAASGLRLSSRDLLKFGILYRNKGKWNGKQILSGKWVEESFNTLIKFPGAGNNSYGYQFWLMNDTLQGKPVKIMAAVGNGDQRIFLDEVNDLVVVTTAGNYNLWTIKNNAYALLRRIYDSFTVR
ncbi:serine hydrolase domain-containing protein [Flavihumibacter sp.]|uniref:serine hydrolase domain-containing protein n=1 Tax=Flavihumibacter sp. TaxID=1913981 RepID=UPI002FC67FD2